MNKLMRRVAGTWLGFLALTSSVPTGAAPATIPQSADTESWIGCVVRDSNHAEYLDESCRAYLVIQLDNNGSVVSYAYHDLGKLPSGAAKPASAITEATSAFLEWNGSSTECHGMEVIMPNGQYRSDCRY